MKSVRLVLLLAWVAVCALAPLAFAATPTSTITLPGREIHGLAYDSWVLWAVHSPIGDGDHTVISALNPITGVTLLESAEFAWNGRGICVAEGSLWVTDALADVVRQVDPTDLHEIGQFSSPGTEPCGITFDGTDLWLSDPWALTIYRLATDGTVLGSMPIPNEFRSGLEWDGSGLWTPVDSLAVGRYTTGGVIDSSLAFAVLPAGTRIFDIAIHDGTWHVADNDRIYTFVGPQAVINLAGRQVLGLTCDSGILWVTHSPYGDSDHGTISALDPATGASLAQSVEFPWNPRGICVAEGSLWVADARADVVHQVDPADFREISSFSTPGSEPCGITFDGTSLWLSDPYARQIHQLSTAGTVLGSFGIPDAYRTGLEWDGAGLWTPVDSTAIGRYATGGAIDSSLAFGTLPTGTRVFDIAFDAGSWYASSGARIYVFTRPQAAITFAGRQVLGLTYDSNVLWVTHSPYGDSNHGMISAVNPMTGAILSQSAELDWNPRGICVGQGSLWIADARADVVHQVDPTDFSQIGSFHTPGSEPCGIAFDGSDLWVNDPWAQKIYRLSTVGAVLGSFDIPNEFRTGLEWDGTGLWTLIDSTTAGHYGTDGTIDATYGLDALPSGTRIIDVAFMKGAWFASAGDKVFLVLPDQLPTLAVGTPGEGAQASLRLLGPNPGRHGGRIAYSLPREMDVRLDVIDVMGRTCAVLQQGTVASGTHTAAWDGRNASGTQSAPGMYFVRLRAGKDVCTTRLVLLQ